MPSVLLWSNSCMLLKELVEERKKARDAKDWAKSDFIRNQIKDLGFEVNDIGDEQQIVKVL